MKKKAVPFKNDPNHQLASLALVYFLPESVLRSLLRRNKMSNAQAEADARMTQFRFLCDGDDSPFSQQSEDGAAPGVSYDQKVFGPRLVCLDKTAKGEELRRLLLAREQDFSDVIRDVERATFLAEPISACLNDVASIRVNSSEIYSDVRELFVSMDIPLAMKNFKYYRNVLRSLRSQLYLSQLVDEHLSAVRGKLESLEHTRDRYEATIFTLQRQLLDYQEATGSYTFGKSTGTHHQPGAVGAAGDHPAAGGASQQGNNKYVVIVQVEDVGSIKSRLRNAVESALRSCRQVVTSTAALYELRRTNFIESKEQMGTPGSYMFVTEDGYRALCFAVEVHLALNKCEDWDKALLGMSKFSDELWRGLRVRVGVHYGVPVAMDVADPTAVLHIEGVAVEKAMRVAMLGAAGESVISTAAHDAYAKELQESRVPPSKMFQSLRSATCVDLPCGKARGFKKGERTQRMWHEALAQRKDSPVETAFEPITFFGLELSSTVNVVDDDEKITPEQMLQAKDTQIVLLQQELDELRMAVIRRDAEMDETKNKLIALLQQFREKIFYFQTMTQLSAEETMKMHDLVAQVEAMKADPSNSEFSDRFSLPVVAPSTEVDFIKELDTQRQRQFAEWSKHENENVEGAGGAPPTTKHKNVQLWRELTSIAKSAGRKVMGQQKLSRATVESVSGGASSVAKIHSVLRAFAGMIRRFLLDAADIKDSDDQGLTEDQFITLFVHIIQPEGSVVNAREMMQLVATGAVDDADTEAAISKDDGRLARSLCGHMARLFYFVRNFKMRTLTAAARPAETPASTGSGTRKAAGEETVQAKQHVKGKRTTAPEASLRRQLPLMAASMLSTSASSNDRKRSPSTTPRSGDGKSPRAADATRKVSASPSAVPKMAGPTQKRSGGGGGGGGSSSGTSPAGSAHPTPLQQGDLAVPDAAPAPLLSLPSPSDAPLCENSVSQFAGSNSAFLLSSLAVTKAEDDTQTLKKENTDLRRELALLKEELTKLREDSVPIITFSPNTAPVAATGGAASKLKSKIIAAKVDDDALKRDGEVDDIEQLEERNSSRPTEHDRGSPEQVEWNVAVPTMLALTPTSATKAVNSTLQALARGASSISFAPVPTSSMGIQNPVGLHVASPTPEMFLAGKRMDQERTQLNSPPSATQLAQQPPSSAAAHRLVPAPQKNLVVAGSRMGGSAGDAVAVGNAGSGTAKLSPLNQVRAGSPMRILALGNRPISSQQHISGALDVLVNPLQVIPSAKDLAKQIHAAEAARLESEAHQARMQAQLAELRHLQQHARINLGVEAEGEQSRAATQAYVPGTMTKMSVSGTAPPRARQELVKQGHRPLDVAQTSVDPVFVADPNPFPSFGDIARKSPGMGAADLQSPQPLNVASLSPPESSLAPVSAKIAVDVPFAQPRSAMVAKIVAQHHRR